VLLLHGGPGLSDYMQLLREELAGWRLVGFQQRGLSPSTIDGPFSVTQNVADAIAVLDAAGESQAIVLGHSWGGHLALQLAVMHPDRVGGVVVIDGLGVTGDGGISALHDELRARLTPPVRAKCDQLEARIDEAGGADDELALQVLKLLWPCYFASPPAAPPPPNDLRVATRCNALATEDAMRHLSDGFAARLRQVTAPTIFVAGEQSPLPVWVAREAAGFVAGSDLTVVPGAGHLPWIEKPGSAHAALARLPAP
jgi:pimeloyl-ACP methyl ester carboxylesterase